MENKKFYQRALLVLLLIISLAFATACGQTKESNTICNKAGLGDKLTDFENTYGKMKKIDDTLVSFASDKISIIPIEDIAYHVTVKIDSSDKLSIEKIKDFLPKDMKIIKEYSEDQFNDGNVRYITVGESELLKTSFPKDEGKFVIIQRIYKNTSSGDYNNFVIGTGTNP
ncbi:hypothetical protein [Anaerosinus sp.]